MAHRDSTTLGARLLVVLGATVMVVATMASPVAAQTDLKDCDDYASQEEAQADLTEGDPYNLDGNNDGVACEEYFGTPTPATAPAGSPENPGGDQDSGTVSGGVQTGFGGLAGGDGSSGSAILLIGAGVIALTAALVVVARRRAA